MNYLVTGGAGFIGSHLVDRLVNQGHTVRVLDNFSTGKKENLKQVWDQIELIEGDIRNPDTCKKACQGVQVVFHEAALGSVPRSVEDPITTNDVNITGTLNMLVAARDAGVKRFVFASSSSVYGNSPILPKVETMPVNPLSPYALSKYTAETYVKLFYDLYGLQTISLRYFNVFGPRQDPNSQYAAVIPLFVSHLLKAQSSTIYGDGEQGRDFTFISDVVAANLNASEAQQSACGKTYNIACQRKTTVNELFKNLKEIITEFNPTVATIQPIYQPPRKGDVKESLAGIDEAKKYLGFVPQVVMQDGLKKTVESYLKSNWLDH